MYWKTEGVVLRETDYKEHDRLLTVLTRDHGPVTMKARGVRGRRSTLKAACQLLAYSEFTVSEQRGYLTITEAVTKEQFPALRQDIELLSLASYFAQVSETIAQEDCPNPELLSLLLNCLYALGPLHKPQPVVKAVFELRAICLAGYLPELSGCFVCGNPMPDRFDLVHGVLQCSGCGPGQGTLVPLSAARRFLDDSRRISARPASCAAWPAWAGVMPSVPLGVRHAGRLPGFGPGFFMGGFAPVEAGPGPGPVSAVGLSGSA